MELGLQRKALELHEERDVVVEQFWSGSVTQVTSDGYCKTQEMVSRHPFDLALA
jgi:hypothetical protein